MPVPQQLLLSAANTLHLDDELELLEALGRTVQSFKDLKPRIGGLADAEDLLGKIAGQVQSAEIAHAFEAVGLGDEHAVLVRLLGKVTDASKKIPNKYRALLSPLGVFAAGEPRAVVSWGVETPAKPLLAADRYTLDLGANAALTFDAGARWPGDAASPRLVKLGAGGGVRADGKATLPYAFGKLGASADAGAHAGLAYYFTPDDGAVYAAFVAGRLAALPDPFDFASVWEVFQDGGCEGLTYEFGGSASADVQVTFADAGALGVGVTVDAAATVSVSASLEASYSLTLRRQDRQGQVTPIHAILTRKRVEASAFGAELKLVADVSALTQPVVKALTRAVGDWDAALAGIKPYLSPGTWLRAHAVEALDHDLQALVSDGALRAALLADLKATLGIGAAEGQLAGWVKGQVTGAIDRGSVLVDGELDAAVERVMSELAPRLPAVAQNAAAAARLKAFLADQAKRVDDGLRAEVGKLLQAPAAALTTALQKAGAKVGGTLTKLDDLLKPVRDLLARVDGVLHEILATAEEAAKKKVTARLFVEEQRQDELAVEIDGVFAGATEEAARAFRALTRGALQGLVQVIDGAPSPGFTLNPEASSISRFSARHSRQGAEISFLGLDLTAAELVDGSARVVLDGRGDIHVSSEGRLQKTLSFLSDREASFVDTHALVLARAMRDDPAGAAPSLEIGLGAAYGEKTLEWKDVREFVEGLTKAGLVRPEALADAKAAFDRFAAAAGGKFRGRISADLRLGTVQAEALMRLDQRADGRLTDAARKQIVVTAENALTRFDAIKVKDFTDGAGAAAGKFLHQPAPASVAEIVLRHQAELPAAMKPGADVDVPDATNTPPAFTGDGQRKYVYFLREAQGLLRLTELIDVMGLVYLARPSATSGDGGWTAKTYADAQATLARDSRTWLTVFKTVAGLFSADITPRTLAFFRTVADLAGLDPARPGGVRLTLAAQGASGEPQTAAFD